jgi:hypothetical protein
MNHIVNFLSTCLPNKIHSLNDVAEDNMFAIQPGGLGGAHEELTAIGVGSSISHGQDSWD